MTEMGFGNGNGTRKKDKWESNLEEWVVIKRNGSTISVGYLEAINKKLDEAYLSPFKDVIGCKGNVIQIGLNNRTQTLPLYADAEISPTTKEIIDKLCARANYEQEVDALELENKRKTLEKELEGL